MKKIEPSNVYKVILSFIFFWISAAAVFIAASDTYVAQNLTKASLSKVQWGELHAEDSIKGSFTAEYLNLNAIGIRFNLFSRINHDHLLFRIKEKGNSNWYYQKRFNTRAIQEDQLVFFTFPKISNSLHKEYIFEIESEDGIAKDSVGLSKDPFIIQTQYNFPKSQIFKQKNASYFIANNIHSHLLSIGIPLFSFLYSFYVSLISVVLYCRKQKHLYFSTFYKLNKNNIFYFMYKYHLIFLIIHLGMFVRVLLAFGPYTADIWSNITLMKFFKTGHFNPYAVTASYNYAFPSYFLMGTIAIVQEKFLNFFSYQFLYRMFLSFVDLITLYPLLKIATYIKVDKVKTTLLFFLNPVSIIISAHHGQRENISIFFLLIAILIHYRYKQSFLSDKNASHTKKDFIKWAFLTTAILLKQNIIYNLIAFWKEERKNLKMILLLFGSSCLIFLLSFIPFLSAKDSIIRNVFLYGGQTVQYGITFYLGKACAICSIHHVSLITLYKYFFITFLFILPFILKPFDMARTCLFWFLFFLSFTSGISSQYFVLPIALGALFPTKWFYLYTAAVTTGFLGGIEENLLLGVIPELIFVFYNNIWIATLIWFFTEWRIRVSK